HRTRARLVEVGVYGGAADPPDRGGGGNVQRPRPPTPHPARAPGRNRASLKLRRPGVSDIRVDPSYPGESVVSEFDSELKLEYARQVHLSGGLTEIRIGNVRIDASEANVIEEVERISPEHKP